MVVLERIRREFRLSKAAAQEIRSELLERGEFVEVVAVVSGLRDPDDAKFLDVLDQSEAEWLCTDDADLHATGRSAVLGVGELVRIIEEVC